MEINHLGKSSKLVLNSTKLKWKSARKTNKMSVGEKITTFYNLFE